MTIIQIRGTSGSGKTTVMRDVMRNLGQGQGHFVTGRKQPLYYWFQGDEVVLGHYESTCGGCDNIGSAPDVYDVIRSLYLEKRKPRVVICEGLLLSEDSKWTSQMKDMSEVRVIFLTTPIETCISQIKSRRKEAGNDKPLNETNSRNRVAVIERARKKLLERGIICRRASSDQAVGIILNWIKE